jgi:hypothetical protein
MINKETLSWLITVPHSDGNFKSNLEKANAETIKEALKDNSLGKTKRKVLESKLKKLENGKKN